MYSTVKTIHIVAIIATFSLFFIRGIWMLQDSPYLQQKWVKILPHFIDTLLFLSGITLVILIQQYPMVHTWLTVKFFAVIAYIILGSIALKFGKTKRIRFMIWLVALGVFAYIVTVALNHSPLMGLNFIF